MPQLKICTSFFRTSKDNLLVTFIFKRKDICISIHQSITIFGFQQFTTAFFRFRPVFLMHIVLHQNRICQTFVKASELCRTGRQAFQRFSQFCFNEICHLFLSCTRLNYFIQRILQIFQRRNWNRSIEIIQQECQPTTTEMSFSHQ